MHCTVSQGDTNCGKRQLRQQTRVEVVKELEHKSVELFRSEKARELMKDGVPGEPPHFYSGGVLRTAKSQATKREYLDPNPIKSLGKMKRQTTKGQNVIRDIGFDPIFVHFWSPHQTRVYNQKIREEGAPIAFDCSGQVAYEIAHEGGEKSQHFFLYLGVISCHAGQFSVVQQISERQNTVTINTWLEKWLESGALIPKEVVSNRSFNRS